MTIDPAIFPHAHAGATRSSLLARIPWLLLLFITILILLLADRIHYLTHFGFLYTEADQTLLWYQADDAAHGIFREPCYYGQAYNVPVEAWLAAPLLLLGVPHPMALPIVSVALALFPFLALAIFAYRKGQRWTASLILLIPLALPVEYVVVTSIPRGFVTGIAVAAPAVVLWLFARSRTAFVLAAFFSVLALTVNPNSSILLLAAGLYALLTHFRSRNFYLFSLLGALLALPAPIFIHLFYKYHPSDEVFRSIVKVIFRWQMLRETLFISPGYSLNTRSLDLFFADFIPIVHRGWYMLVVLACMIAIPLLLGRFKAAISLATAVFFIVLTLGIARVHSALPQVFYSGSRMYLALPVLFALFLLWCGNPLPAPFKSRRLITSISSSILLCALIACAALRNLSVFNAPSPLLDHTWPLSIESVPHLVADARATADICRKYNVTLVLPCDNFLSCFNDAGPLLSNHAFETLYPPFERRTFRITDERTHLHTAVLLYRPSLVQRLFALNTYPHTSTVFHSPDLLLIQLDKPRSGFDIATSVGLTYNPYN